MIDKAALRGIEWVRPGEFVALAFTVLPDPPSKTSTVLQATEQSSKSSGGERILQLCVSCDLSLFGFASPANASALAEAWVEHAEHGLSDTCTLQAACYVYGCH